MHLLCFATSTEGGGDVEYEPTTKNVNFRNTKPNMQISNLRTYSIAGPEGRAQHSKTRPPRLASPPSCRGNTQSSPCCQLTDEIASHRPGFGRPYR